MTADDATDPEGAAAKQSPKDLASPETNPPEDAVSRPQDDEAQLLEEGEVSESADEPQPDSAKETQPEDYKWIKRFYTAEPGTQDFYFQHLLSEESKWEEPEEPYWLFNHNTGLYHYSVDGNLIKTAEQLGKIDPAAQAVSDPQAANVASAATDAQNFQAAGSEEYQGYNPQIHGSYDPNAPYAQYHNRLRAEEAAKVARDKAIYTPEAFNYAAAGTFNRFTGAFQAGDKNADHHNDYNKSGRQLNAYFDVEAAANAHEGRSLKEERRNQKLSKKEVAEMNAKRKARKEKKRRDFLLS